MFVCRYRLRNKKISATVRTFPLLNKVGVNSTVSTTTGNVISVIGSPEATGKMVPSSNGIANLESGVPQLIPRCADTSLRALENSKKGGKTGANGQNVSGSPTESLPEKLVTFFFIKITNHNILSLDYQGKKACGSEIIGTILVLAYCCWCCLLTTELCKILYCSADIIQNLDSSCQSKHQLF